jgi:hypothetical protein
MLFLLLYRRVPNAKPGRDSIEYEIYGMEGIPDEFLSESAKRQKMISAATAPEPVGRQSAAAYAAATARAIMPQMIGNLISQSQQQLPPAVAYPGYAPPRGPMPGAYPSQVPPRPPFYPGIPATPAAPVNFAAPPAPYAAPVAPPPFAGAVSTVPPPPPPGSLVVPPPGYPAGYPYAHSAVPVAVVAPVPGALPAPPVIQSAGIFKRIFDKSCDPNLLNFSVIQQVEARLVYNDDNESMEEKRSRLPKYNGIRASS